MGRGLRRGLKGVLRGSHKGGQEGLGVGENSGSDSQTGVWQESAGLTMALMCPNCSSWGG